MILESKNYIHYSIVKDLIKSRHSMYYFVSTHKNINKNSDVTTYKLESEDSFDIERSILFGIDYVVNTILYLDYEYNYDILNYDMFIPSSIFTDANDLDIVFSSHNEQFKWDSNNYTTFSRLFYYKKGKYDLISDISDSYMKINTRVINLENSGMEIATFLYHIIENYENLADRTLFIRGQILSDIIENKSVTPKELVCRNIKFTGSKTILEYSEIYEYLNFLIEYVDTGYLSKRMEFEDFANEFFDIYYIPDKLVILNSLNFLVHKDYIYSKDISFYKKLYDFLIYDKNPIERIYTRLLLCTLFNNHV